MAGRVTCQNCGGRVDLPDGHYKSKIRCPHCGYYAEVPPEARSAATATPAVPKAKPVAAVAAKPVVRAVPAIDPRDKRPRFETDGPRGAPLLEGTEDDDGKPYAVPGTGTVPCPHCRGELPLGATLCVHCGKDIGTGAKVKREFQPIHRTWEEGWPGAFRAKVLAGVTLADVLLVGITVATGGVNLCSATFMLTFQIALQAFLLGTFDALTVRRTAKGQATLTRNRRIAFTPIKPEKLSWKDSHAVGIVATHDPGFFSWLICAYLFLLGVVPGVVFYWVFIRPERFTVTVCDVHGGTDDVIFRCTDH
ncbi:MAG: hypothetical protein ACRC7O_08305, partial [Fimbriiglobus sp.]